ncbi:chromate transporter [Youngiibacter multivorans]|uniref:Chromate transporter n=1 Tax=Youngiibacter multivorans TaxID=937251 RepID=A0ABS4FZP1_9CLOT|nr:chromate transporter [Youngiibacter multivorans]MBP1917749.1 chromate transporter [Youngiibacter multivorans]
MEEKSNLRKAVMIFLFFVRIGAFTFGGGWSILAQMQKEFVEKRQWLTNEELMDIASVGRSLPGIMITNISVIFGYRMGGAVCGAAAAIGVSLPSIVILSVVTLFYDKLRDTPYMAKAFVGIRAAVVPIIGSAALALRKASLKDTAGWIIAGFALILGLFTGISSIWVVVAGAAAGLAIKGGGANGAS